MLNRFDVAGWHRQTWGNNLSRRIGFVPLAEAIRLKVLEEADELYNATDPADIDDEAADVIIVALVMMDRFGDPTRSPDDKLADKFARVVEKHS